MIPPNDLACNLCKHIPSRMEVEILHTPDRLPEEIERLEIIGGNHADSTLGQLRKCPECGTYYRWLHDHDSESGSGYGYTDEGIERISPKQALECIHANLKQIQNFERREAHKEEKERLMKEREAIEAYGQA